MKLTQIIDFKLGRSIQGFFICKEKHLRYTRNGDLYLDLVLSDSTGIIQSKMWDLVDDFQDRFNGGDPVAVKGKVGEFNEIHQLTVSQINLASSEQYGKYGFSPELLLKSVDEPLNELWNRLSKLSKSIKKPLRDKTVNMGMFVDDNTGSPYFLNETIQNKKPLDRYQDRHPDYDKGYLMSNLEDTGSLDKYYQDITITHAKPKTSKRSLDTSQYNFNTQFEPVLSRNVKMENELMLGTPTNPKNRSYGYRNPQENYFNYLEEEPHQVNYVEPWTRGGEVTRLDNKKMAHDRDIF